MNGISGTLVTGVPLALDQTGVTTAKEIQPSTRKVHVQDHRHDTPLSTEHRTPASRTRDDASPPPLRPVARDKTDLVSLSETGRTAAQEAAVVSLYPIGGRGRARGMGVSLGQSASTSASATEVESKTPVSAFPEADTSAEGGTAIERDDASEPEKAEGKTAEKPKTEPELTADEQRMVETLVARDREVRAHEQAHKAAGGRHAGAIAFAYTTGPDGKRYATSGEVPVDLSPVRGDPAATKQKLEQVRRAALAPADPSGADRRIAARASRLIRQAHGEVLEDAMAQESGEKRPDASSEVSREDSASVEREKGVEAAVKGPKRGPDPVKEEREESESIPPIVGNPHHRPPSVSPDAQVPVKLNLSVYA